MIIKTQVQPISVIMPTVKGVGCELNRLLAAAVVNDRFQKLLLDHPEKALQEGYQGETFFLTREEYDLVLSIRASTLKDFAVQLVQTFDSHPKYSIAAISV
jgi:hypothetical protein